MSIRSARTESDLIDDLPGRRPAAGNARGKFDAASCRSDGVALALREVEQWLRVADRLAACTTIPRGRSEHAELGDVPFSTPADQRRLRGRQRRQCAAPRGEVHVLPPFAQDVFERLGRVIGCGHVSGLDAACHDRWPVWRCAALARIKMASFRLVEHQCVSRPGSDRSFALTVRRPPHTPDVPLVPRSSHLFRSQQPQEPYNPRPSSTWPRSTAPSCWRAQSPPTSAACEPGCVGATFRPALPCAKPSARRP